jgi:hypothetical protein
VVRGLGKRTVTVEWYNGFLNHPAGCGAVLRRQGSRSSVGVCDEAEGVGGDPMEKRLWLCYGE